MDRRKKILALTALAAVCMTSVAGSLSYLAESAGRVENTFIASGGGRLLAAGGSFTLTEHEATPVMVRDASGNEIPSGAYEILPDAKTVTGQTYAAVPGIRIPKDPVIEISGKTELPAYLYVEVVDQTAENENMDWRMDEENWTLLLTEEKEMARGPHGGQVYFYRKGVVNDQTEQGRINILQDQEIVIGSASDTGTGAKGQINFYGYLTQAVTGTEDGNTTDPAAIFQICFPDT